MGGTPLTAAQIGGAAQVGADRGGHSGRVTSTTKPCTFCEIVAGRTPAHQVYAGELAVAFLDTSPVFRGHTLLVPRRHVTTLPELPAEDVGAFFTLAQRLTVAVQDATGSDGILNLVNNVISQSVPHLHFHVIPRRRKDGLRFWLGPREKYADAAEAAATAEAIAGAFSRSDGR
jgi:histidine triad (HIT) family protein